MNFSQSFRLALKSLTTSKTRALLTMLGIIIGVAAVIVITSLGNGMRQMMNEQFDRLGANQLQIRLRGGDTRAVVPGDIFALVDKYPQYLACASPYMGLQAVIRDGADEYKHTDICGVSEVFYDANRNLTMTGEAMAEGRFLSYIDVERYQYVCVIGDYLAREAFHGMALGQTLTVQGAPFTVVGVLDRIADSTEGSSDDVMFLPYGDILRLSENSEVTSYLLNSYGKDTSSVAKELIESRLFQTYQDEDAYYVTSNAEIMDALNSMMGTMLVVLVAIAAISLLVGGIGIMNIMLVSVTERTREIGIRKSLGAKRRDIRSQFIIESGTTAAIGGVLGIVVGIGLARLAGPLIGGAVAAQLGGGTFSAIPTVGSVSLAFGVSVGIGILFGYLPANKAAKLNPIDALHYD